MQQFMIHLSLYFYIVKQNTQKDDEVFLNDHFTEEKGTLEKTKLADLIEQHLNQDQDVSDDEDTMTPITVEEQDDLNNVSHRYLSYTFSLYIHCLLNEFQK